MTNSELSPAYPPLLSVENRLPRPFVKMPYITLRKDVWRQKGSSSAEVKPSSRAVLTPSKIHSNRHENRRDELEPSGCEDSSFDLTEEDSQPQLLRNGERRLRGNQFSQDFSQTEGPRTSENKRHACEFCGAKYRKRGMLERHKRKKHRNLAVRYDHRGDRIQRKSELRRHAIMASSQAQRRLPCSLCQASFRFPAGLQRHQSKAHGIARRQVPSRRRRYQKGPDAPVEMNPPCHICGKEFLTSEMLRLHLKNHVARTFPCSQCGKIFPARRLLQVHEERNHIQMPHSCSVCGASFRFQSTLRRHAVVHTLGRRSTRSQTDSQSVSDVNSVTGKDPHDSFSELTVEADDDSLSSSSSYSPCFADTKSNDTDSATVNSRPTRSVSPSDLFFDSKCLQERRFKCPVCCAGFDLHIFLESHMRLHTRLAYECSECDAKFTSHLKRTVHFLQNH